MTKPQKQTLFRLLLGVAAFITAMLILWKFSFRGTFSLLLILPAYLILGGDVLLHAGRNILQGKVFDENFLMSIATIGALFLGEYPEAVAVMLFYQIGEFFQDYAVSHSRSSIAALMNIRPDYANIRREGVVVRVDPEEVAIGDLILVKPGERIPLDGEIVEGFSTLDASALTGESLPRDTAPGDTVISGCVNLSGLLTIRATKRFGESTVAKILDLVENAGTKKAKSEQFITKFARYYTPCVVIAAVLLAVLPPLVIPGAIFSDWIKRALIFLVISCPCALVISIPLSFFGGIGGASKQGVLIKGGNYLEALARAELVVFDKTGTLTKGTFHVTAVHPDLISEEQLLELAALAESYSSHPISLSLRLAYSHEIDSARVTDVEEVPGYGVKANVDGKAVCVGNSRMMDSMGTEWKACHYHGTTVHLTVDGVYAGHIVIADELREDSKQAVHALRELGVHKMIMLTGDTPTVAKQVAEELGLDGFYAGLLPADKVAQMEYLLGEKSEKGTLLFVGDGINDAPVLARADIGIAMGGLGSDAAIEAADIVIMDDKPSKIAQAIQIARKTLRLVHQNIIFALAVKAVILVLGAFGYANMWLAVFADVGVSMLATLNAMRAMRG